LDLKNDQVSILNQEVSNLLEQRKSLESELKNIKDTNTKLIESRNSEQDRSPEAQKRKIEFLKQQDINQTISNSCPDLTQVPDVVDVKTPNVPKDDIISLHAVIKGTSS